MRAIKEQVIKTIREYALIPPGSKVLLGLSGGRDSVALLHILQELQERSSFVLYAAHFNHRIRKESAEEETFVQELCHRLNVPLIIDSADIPAFAYAQGLSIEVAARRARHDFFKRSLAESGCSLLALAHHQNDRAETLLLNLMRGSGAEGLAAMPVRDGYIIRPLLMVSRQEINAYCAAKGLEWREDASNADLSIPRNRVRCELLPNMAERFNPAIVSVLARTAEILEGDEEYFTLRIREILTYARQDAEGVKVPLSALNGLHPALLHRAIRALCKMAGLHSDVEYIHVCSVREMLDHGDTGGGVDIGRGYRVVRDADVLAVLYPDEREIALAEIPLVIPGETVTPWGTFRSVRLANKPEDWRFHDGRKQYFSAVDFPVDAVVRTRRPGDMIHPLGAPGHRKLKEYMIDRKIERRRRDFVPLVCRKDKVLWVAGYEMDDGLRLTQKDGEVLAIEYLGNQ